MWIIERFLAGLLLASIAVQNGAALAQESDESTRLIVRCAPSTDDSPQRAITEVAAELGSSHCRPFYPFRFRNPDLAARLGLDRTFILEIPPSSETRTAMTALGALDGVEFVEMDAEGSVAGLIPNDPDFTFQWNMHNVRFPPSVRDADVDGPETWDIHFGSPDAVTIAIVDSGVTPHPEFADRMVLGINVVDLSEKVYWAEGDGPFIRRSNPDGTNVEAVAVANFGSPSHVTVDLQNQRLYWIETDTESIPSSARVVRSTLGGGDLEYVVLGLQSPGGLAVNPVLGFLYWTDTTGVFRSNLNGTGLVKVVNEATNVPGEIDADIRRGTIYWWFHDDESDTSTINRAKSNGVEIETVTSVSPWFPGGLAVDPHAQYVYWSESMGIRRATLNGLNVQDVVADALGATALGLDLVSEHVFWVERDSGTVWRSYLDGTSAEPIASELLSPSGVSFQRGSTADGCPHGTHVAGIAAAKGNNGLGVAGMNWDALVMPVKIMPACTGSESQFAAGLMWAVDHGANVVNMSVQYYIGTEVLRDAVTYAHESGAILVAAAGNNQGRTVAYPARLNEAIAVSATNDRDQLAGFSNYGPQVDVSAPGDDVWSTWIGGGYAQADGTSMAAPHVSGLASLILSYQPKITREGVRSAILETAEDQGPCGMDDEFGFGRVNARKALLAASGGPVGGITASIPSDCAIDARQPSEVDGTGATGWNSVMFTFEGGVADVHVGDFTLRKQGGSPAIPVVSSVVPLDGRTVEVRLNRTISVGSWNTITHEPSGTSIRIGYLPGDVNGDATSHVRDILALVDWVNGVGGPLEIWSVDINRSNEGNSIDILREIDLLNGAGAYPVFNELSLP